jgi:transketolase
MTPLAPSLDTLHILARRIRRYSILATTKAGSGHPSSSISATELITALFFTAFRYDFSSPKRLDNDRFVLSKGHAAPLLYAAWTVANLISEADLLSLRRLDSVYEGHPTPRIPWVDVATGSLGQGLPNAVGMAAFLKNVVGSPARVWALCGDGEMAEGSNWEAIPVAAELGLTNLTAIVDINRLEQSVPTRLGWNLDRYSAQFEAFGWETLVIDGHDLSACVRAMTHVTHGGLTKPLAILARTKKGAGVSFMADLDGWHGKPMDDAQTQKALLELGADESSVVGQIAKPVGTPRRAPHEERGTQPSPRPHFPPDKTIATRRAFGEALSALGSVNPSVIVFDADVKNSTYTELFEKAHPDRFIECFIAEQAMVGLAAGAGAISAVPWVATFAAFLTRAFDQVRMAALSSANLKICGSHAGVSIGEDGASQMGLEDLAMFRAVHGSCVVYPADPYATWALVFELSAFHGVSYLRATRAATPVLYGPDEKFPIGGSKTLRHSETDSCLIVAAGITLHESLKAHAKLSAEGISVRVVDAYSVKPIDKEGLRAAAQATSHRVIVVEDHWIEGGLGDAVLEVFAECEKTRVRKLAVSELPHSGKPEELLDLYGLSANKIADAVRAFVK